MSQYIYNPNWPFREYLQAQSFEDSVNGQISLSSREIVATQEQLHSEHIEVTRELAGNIESGFENISWQITGVREDLAELNATCQLGFNGVITSLGLISSQLYDLQWMAKHPSLTWANEQFHEAKRSFERGWHEESLSFIHRAINGHASHIGCAVDFRYHYLLGAIRLGDDKNKDDKVIDVKIAEKAFLDSAKFSRHDEPQEAARALFLASWSAYCLGSMKNAEQHARNALSLNSMLGPAHFQLAKVLMHVHRPDEALPFLEKAIRIERKYAVTVLLDKDFTNYLPKVNKLLSQLKSEAQRIANQAFGKTRQTLIQVQALEIGGWKLMQIVGHEIKSAAGVLDAAHKQIQTNTYFGFLNAMPLLEETDSKLIDIQTGFADKTTAIVEKLLRDDNTMLIQRQQKYMSRKPFAAGLFPAGFIGFVIAVWLGGFFSALTSSGNSGKVYVDVVPVGCVGIVLGILGWIVINFVRSENMKAFAKQIEARAAKLEKFREQLGKR